MFLIASIIFLVFTAVYAVSGILVILHLKWYSLPNHPLPRFISGLFAVISAALWLGALAFLFNISS